MVGAQPVLIDFAASIFERRIYDAENGSVLHRDVSRRSIGSRLHRLTFGGNPVAVSNSTKFIDLLKQESRRPVVLVVGGGTIGSGAEELYRDDSIELVGTDVYASPHTVLVADAHKLPFDDGVFDGVWVQAVLEHVLEPAAVVAELHRVLRPDGIFLGTDSVDSDLIRDFHVDDVFVPLPPDQLAARLEAVGFRDAEVNVGDFELRFRATKPAVG